MKAWFSFILLFFFVGCTNHPTLNEAMDKSTPMRGVASARFLSPFADAQTQSQFELVNAVIRRLGPVRNQLDTQICFGNAIGDVATFHSSARVSAFSVAVRNFQKRSGFDYIFFNPGGVISDQVSSNSRYMLGLASSVLKSSLDTTLCADDQPTDGLTYRDSNLKRLWDSYGRFRSYVGPTAPFGLYREIKNQLSIIAPSLDAADFVSHISRYKPLDIALGEWFDRACQIKVQPNQKLEVVGGELGLAGADKILAMVNQALEAGEMAVIHYDPGVLEAEDPSIWQSAVGFHISTIVARAQIDGKNHFLLRNSWGSNCQIYSQSVAKRCDRGHIWLTEEEVRKFATSVSYYQPVQIAPTDSH